eukprot:TRINITY_DN1033_c2_g2_i1.p1 TRINITY_DN1033_c2_g2~~TRINITY_DN1033_c2_g2_i1.p1  ORF type:complete len:594 (-),score=156.76 TRINITY_DN1033_c2_g2_i1:186-1967(-)
MNRSVFLFSFLFLLFFLNEVSYCQNGVYLFNELQELGRYKNSWIDVSWGIPDDDETSIYFNVTAATTGWVGVGFNEPGNTMPDSDIIVFSVPDTERIFETTAIITDRYALHFETPRIDTLQDVELLYSIQNFGLTNCIFKRKQITGDNEHDYNIVANRKTEMLLAIGSSDQFVYHFERTNIVTDLLAGKTFGNSKNGWDGDQVGHYSNDDDSFEVQWGFTNDDEIVWKIKAKTKGWFAIGLSDNPYMPESDMIVCVVEDDDNDNEGLNRPGYAFDRYISDKHGTPKMDLSQDVKVLYATQYDGYSYISISRKLKTGDLQDRDISEDDDETGYLLWAIGKDDKFEYHHKRGSVEIDWFDGDTGSSLDDLNPLRWLHGVLMIFSWLFLNLLTIGLTRYNKFQQGGIWLISHIVMTIVIILCTIVAFIFIVVYASLNNSSTHFDDYHSIAGLLIFLTSLFQPILVTLTRLPYIKPKGKLVRVFSLITAQHKNLGYLLMIFSIINIGTGLYLYDPSTGIWVCFSLWIFVAVCFWFVYEMLKVIPSIKIGKFNENNAPKAFASLSDSLITLLSTSYTLLTFLLFTIIFVLFAVYTERS